MLKAEELDQITLLEWLAWNYPEVAACTFHIANERKCSRLYGAKLKRLGVKAGVPDLMIPWPTTRYPGLFIEMKSKTGKPSLSQKKFIATLSKRGYYACFCFGYDAAVKVITNYLKDSK